MFEIPAIVGYAVTDARTGETTAVVCRRGEPAITVTIPAPVLLVKR
jgi:hypothetical protein